MLTTIPGSRNGQESVAQTRRKCALCGKTYAQCRCTCPSCKAKIWQRHRGEWHHHVCYKKR